MSNMLSTSTRTYGRRQGRPIKSSKQLLIEELLPVIAIDLAESEHRINPHIYFDREAPVWMEIGFGGGEHLVQLAVNHPDINFIGCEPFLNGVASLLESVHKHALTNIRIFQGNALDLLKTFQHGCLSRLYLMFADPWPKKRHHKRRFVQEAILDSVMPILKVGAQFRLATDHADYQQWILTHLRKRSDLQEVLCTFEKPKSWPMTRYESKAIHEGRKALYMIYKYKASETDCDRTSTERL
jgi:tRNA (guanine-N7-)-methyltransferase